MLAEVKEIWKSITDKDVPVGIIFSLIVIDCIFYKKIEPVPSRLRERRSQKLHFQKP